MKLIFFTGIYNLWSFRNDSFNETSFSKLKLLKVVGQDVKLIPKGRGLKGVDTSENRSVYETDFLGI